MLNFLWVLVEIVAGRNVLVFQILFLYGEKWLFCWMLLKAITWICFLKFELSLAFIIILLFEMMVLRLTGKIVLWFYYQLSKCFLQSQNFERWIPRSWEKLLVLFALWNSGEWLYYGLSLSLCHTCSCSWEGLFMWNKKSHQSNLPHLLLLGLSVLLLV